LFLKFDIDHGGSVETKTSSFDNNFSHAQGQATIGDRKPIAVVYVDRELTVDMEGALQFLQKDLFQDNYVIPGPLDVPGSHTGAESLSNLGSYIKEDSSEATEITYTRLKEFLSRNKEENKNIILSSKDLADLDPQKLSDLLSPDFYVRIVMVYRRFYDRLFSKYYTDHKDDTEPYETFSDFAEGFVEVEDASVGELFTKFKKTFEDVVVLETIRGKEISQAFFCDVVITDAPKSCRAVKDFSGTIVSLPDYGNTLEYQRFLVEAQSRGILTKKIDMEVAINALWENVVDENTNAMPKICGDVGTKIKKFSSDEEKVLFPEWSKFHLERDYVKFKEHLCSIDVEAVLKDDYWLTIIKKLDSVPLFIESDKGFGEKEIQKLNTNSSRVNNSKPILIMHIGPHKTGCTTIHTDSPTFADALQKDGYVYKKFGARDYPKKMFSPNQCLYETKAYLLNHTNALEVEGQGNNVTLGKEQKRALDVPCWNDRLSLLLDGYNNENIVISEEEFNAKRTVQDYEAIKIAFQDWNLLFVATYRRFAEWLLSAFKEAQKPSTTKATWKKPRCENPWDYIEKNDKFNYSTSRYKNLDQTVVRMKAANLSVQIINFHDKKHITSSLYCDGIPDTPNTCDLALNRTENTISNSRSILSIACCNLVYDAKEMGFINASEITRLKANNECESLFAQNDIGQLDLPLICPTDDMLEKLLNKSLTFEKMMVPEIAANEKAVQDHKESFWKMARDRQFCHVNNTVLLKDGESWDGILSKIRMNTKSGSYKSEIVYVGDSALN